MAEHLSSALKIEDESNVTILRPGTIQDQIVDNITFLNANPEENKHNALRSIGRLTMSMTVRDKSPGGIVRDIQPGYGEILSSEPMRMSEDIQSGVIEVDFLQYWQGYRGDNFGTAHSGYKRPQDNDKSLETVRILTMRWTPHPETIEGTYLHPRNHKHKLLDYWSRLRSMDGRKQIQAIRSGLWDSPDQLGME